MVTRNKCLARSNKSRTGDKATKRRIGHLVRAACAILRGTIMAEQPVNLLTAIYLGVFSRAEQRVLQAIFKAIAEGGGRWVATLANARPQLEHKQVNHAQRDHPSGRNRPSGKDGTPLFLRCLAPQHFSLREAFTGVSTTLQEPKSRRHQYCG